MSDEPDHPETPPPSRLYLPKLESPPATILEYVIARFPRIPPRTWHLRVERGLVTSSDGTPFDEDSPYRHGIFVFYRKEVPFEPAPVEEETILYHGQELLIADKPHGMPVTPAGEYVLRSLLVRLQKSTGISTLAPMHRLDRETAGVVMFSIRPDTRSHYHQLFAERRIERTYKALGHVYTRPAQRQWRVENRLGEGVPWFRRKIVEGTPNAITEIELLQLRKLEGLFSIQPQTGKKHQIRIHMTSIGFPVLGDPLYPEIRTHEGNFPLQLLAERLRFVDPLSGKTRTFTSERTLMWT
jgi:tRNA pseudouridine32 synthase/23S rRNA pseudouridine746 synthase